MKLTSRETVTCDRKNKTCNFCDKSIEIGRRYVRLYWNYRGYSCITVAHAECAKGEASKGRS